MKTKTGSDSKRIILKTPEIEARRSTKISELERTLKNLASAINELEANIKRTPEYISNNLENKFTTIRKYISDLIRQINQNDQANINAYFAHLEQAISILKQLLDDLFYGKANYLKSIETSFRQENGIDNLLKIIKREIGVIFYG